MKVNIEKLSELEPGKVYAVEVADQEQFHTFMQMAVYLKEEFDLHFFCYMKDRMKFIGPQEVDEIVTRIRETANLS